MAPPPKRRKLAVAPVAEIVFDNDARHDYLTGFHKRKVQRAKHAQEVAEKRAKEERREHRRKMREERQAELQRALEQNRIQMAELNGASDGEEGSNPDQESDEQWEGFADPAPVDYEAEYIDENKYTTVTVEDMDPSKEGLYKAAEENEEDDEKDTPKATSTAPNPPEKRKSTKADHNQAKKKKKKKFRYESPAERKVTRMKERMGNRKQAKARRAT
ncbi:conserved hypothetical protein [Uncinocarpus reesii 1704]|uniref:Protein required for cell viability Rrp17 n=1 Tax=Uncinocarpus reesii (strain UAMH 1704) TaxID=336963 RepID=C4JZW8_UNCRE|nr:uncharacterized protein UREG_07719 [Uncinocarpus reesii 1704]EEP82854.1 conserved hypothetical protein [Uncinocarpus reesii 1704]